MAGNGVQMPLLNWGNHDQVYAFKDWHNFLSSYFVINKVKEEEKWHYIMLSSGTKLIDSWELSDTEKKNSSNVLKKFEDDLVDTPNKWVMRLELAAMVQKDGESIDDFICRLKAKANQCNFSVADRDKQIVFQLIKGILWPEAQKRLIERGNDLKLEKAVECAQSFEATIQNASSFVNKANVNAMHARHRECKYCTYKHPQGRCPAYGKKCKQCGGDNHFSKSKLCRGTKKSLEPSAANQDAEKRPAYRQKNRRKDNGKQKLRNVHELKVDGQENVLDCGSVDISMNDVKCGVRQSVIKKLNVKPPDVKCKVNLSVKADTGANGSILPTRCLKQMYPSNDKQ